MEKIRNVSFGKITGHKHPYNSDFIPRQTYPYHVSYHRLMPVKALSTVDFPPLNWNSLMGMYTKQLTLGPNTMIHHHYKREYK